MTGSSRHISEKMLVFIPLCLQVHEVKIWALDVSHGKPYGSIHAWTGI